MAKMRKGIPLFVVRIRNFSVERELNNVKIAKQFPRIRSNTGPHCNAKTYPSI